MSLYVGGPTEVTPGWVTFVFDRSKFVVQDDIGKFILFGDGENLLHTYMDQTHGASANEAAVLSDWLEDHESELCGGSILKLDRLRLGIKFLRSEGI